MSARALFLRDDLAAAWRGREPFAQAATQTTDWRIARARSKPLNCFRLRAWNQSTSWA